MHAKFLSFVIFVFLACLHIEGAPPRRAFNPPPPPPQYKPDYFILALTWPPSFCLSALGPCQPSMPTRQFTIHGFWPQIYGGILHYCSKSLPAAPVLKDANNFPAGKIFWNHEWMKHCSQFSPKKYFPYVINLARTYNVISILKSEVNAMMKHMKAVVQLSCSDIPSQLQDKLFTEIRLCFEKDGATIKSCTNQYGNCKSPKGKIKFP